MNDINYFQQKLSIPNSIASNLDAQDNNTDGKIKGSIWNQFIRSIEVGETIGDNNTITVEQAIDRIKAYAKNSFKPIDNVLQEWFEKTKPADIKMEDCRKTDCKGVYFHEATRTHYREASGKLWKVEPRIKDARIIFNSDGTRTEHIGGTTGPQTIIFVNKDNKIYRKEYYSGIIFNENLQKIETFDNNEKLIKTEEYKPKKQKYAGYTETLCKGVYYHDATSSHYREVNGKLQKIEPITSKDARIMFNEDGTRYEIEHKSINDKRIAIWTLVSKNNKIIKTTEEPD